MDTFVEALIDWNGVDYDCLDYEDVSEYAMPPLMVGH